MKTAPKNLSAHSALSARDETEHAENRWVRDAEGRLRRATVHHMGRRLPSWDYRREGYYVVTIVLNDRRSGALGELEIKKPTACAVGASGTGNAVEAGGTGAAVEWLSVDAAKKLGLKPEVVEARVAFSKLGAAIFAHFRRMGDFTRGLEPVYCAIMPDHLHLLVKVWRELERPLGNAIGGFKTGCEKIYAKMGGEGRLFAEGFVDQVVLRAGQLATELNYLQDNPRRLAIKRLFPDLFKVLRRMAVNLRLAPQGQAGQGAPQGQAGRGASQGQAGHGAPLDGGAVQPAPTARAVGYFASLGNPFLLGRPLAQVQVSRRFFGYRRVAKPGGGLKIAKNEKGEPIVEFSTPEFEARREALFAAAKCGAVLLSPCVSDGERQIAREALAAGLPLITMANKGFSPLQKPSGRYFDACADGRLLMLAPAAWPYQPGEKPMTRFDATAMNRLCQWIAGENAAEINYHGMKPTNVDELALAAACVSRRGAENAEEGE